DRPGDARALGDAARLLDLERDARLPREPPQELEQGRVALGRGVVGARRKPVAALDGALGGGFDARERNEEALGRDREAHDLEPGPERDVEAAHEPLARGAALPDDARPPAELEREVDDPVLDVLEPRAGADRPSIADREHALSSSGTSGKPWPSSASTKRRIAGRTLRSGRAKPRARFAGSRRKLARTCCRGKPPCPRPRGGGPARTRARRSGRTCGGSRCSAP